MIAALASPSARHDAALTLAARLGGTELLLFARDPELNVSLPAPGLPQVLPGAAQWRDFLDGCARSGEHSGSLRGPDGRVREAVGCALDDGTAAVLLDSSSAAVRRLRPFLPLLGALFRAERQVDTSAVRVRSATEAFERSRVLAGALQGVRERLQKALAEAQHARTEARARAEQAEQMATELEAQTEELQQQATEMEMINEELSVRTREAEEAQEAADRANRAKSEFLANMSHELRTPINAVLGYTQLLSMGITGPVSEAQHGQLMRIQSSSRHLLSLINDVLDLAKVEAGEMDLQHEREGIDVVVKESLAIVEVEAVEQGIAVENRCGGTGNMYFGDRDRVRQILVNLLSNAVKFTESGGHVTLTTDVVDEADAEVTGAGPWTCIAVEDTGIGIGPDEQTRVFQPFVQADGGHTRRRGGTGLGLTISRQLARLMGGDLTLTSERGVGSRFTLWLPAAAPRAGTLDPAIRVGARGE